VNLGQLIGELRLALAEGVPDAPLSPCRRYARTGTSKRLREAMRAAGDEGLTTWQLRAATGLDSYVVSRALPMMADVEHVGEKGQYRYRLKAAA
jgi:hypothetical protein